MERNVSFSFVVLNETPLLHSRVITSVFATFATELELIKGILQKGGGKVGKFENFRHQHWRIFAPCNSRLLQSTRNTLSEQNSS